MSQSLAMKLPCFEKQKTDHYWLFNGKHKKIYRLDETNIINEGYRDSLT